MDVKEALKIIKRGAVDLISEEELIEKLKEASKYKRPLCIKAGFDPTAPDIHIGHTVLLRKLRQFQDLGHIVHFLIGDFTGLIGDPSGKNELRKPLTEKEVLENAKTYEKQIFKILDKSKTKIVFNSKWINKLGMEGLLNLSKLASVNQLLAREDFKKRYTEGRSITLLEFIYPLLQGYDSVHLKADVELGGKDQIFNLLMGRELQQDFGQKPQVVITMPLLAGLDGVQKMSKSLNNYVGINEEPKEMFGKLMSISDELMYKYYELLTDEDLEKVKNEHPMEAKKKLAEIITTEYHGQKQAEKAADDFKSKIQDVSFDKVELVTFEWKAPAVLFDILNAPTDPLKASLSSKSEVRRLFQQGGIKVDDKKVSDLEFKLEPGQIYNIRIGKKIFRKIRIK